MSRDYLDLYQVDDTGEMSKGKMDDYPKGDDAMGKPKGKRGGVKNKVGKGGTKAKKTATTTSGPDDRMSPSDMDKAHPGYDKPTPN